LSRVFENIFSKIGIFLLSDNFTADFSTFIVPKSENKTFQKIKSETKSADG
jgi:hypothetical protein